MSCFDTARVIGQSLDPVPPASSMPRMGEDSTRIDSGTHEAARYRRRVHRLAPRPLPAVGPRVSRWLVTGAAGMLGHDLVEVLGRQPGVTLNAVDRRALDITDP